MPEIAIVRRSLPNVVPRLACVRLASEIVSGNLRRRKIVSGSAATCVPQLVETLRRRPDSLSQLLHFHPIADKRTFAISDRRARVRAYFYAEPAVKLGVIVQCFDAGGGLGVGITVALRRKVRLFGELWPERICRNNIIRAIGDACKSMVYRIRRRLPSLAAPSLRTIRYWSLTLSAWSVTNTDPTAPAEDEPRALQNLRVPQMYKPRHPPLAA